MRYTLWAFLSSPCFSSTPLLIVSFIFPLQSFKSQQESPSTCTDSLSLPLLCVYPGQTKHSFAVAWVWRRWSDGQLVKDWYKVYRTNQMSKTICAWNITLPVFLSGLETLSVFCPASSGNNKRQRYSSREYNSFIQAAELHTLKQADDQMEGQQRVIYLDPSRGQRCLFFSFYFGSSSRVWWGIFSNILYGS